MIKFAILGFLMYRKLTGYDIKQVMQQSTSNFMNASFGSIYPALDKLEKEGLIDSKSAVENGKHKKLYEINDKGRAAFISWLEEPIDFMRAYEDILIKVFFYGLLPKEKAVMQISQLIESINKKIKELEGLEPEIRQYAGYFEASTLYFGIDHLRFTAGWYEKLLGELNNKKSGDVNESIDCKRFYRE